MKSYTFGMDRQRIAGVPRNLTSRRKSVVVHSKNWQLTLPHVPQKFLKRKPMEQGRGGWPKHVSFLHPPKSLT